VARTDEQRLVLPDKQNLYKNVLLLLVTAIFIFIMAIETPLIYINGIFAFSVYMSFFTQKKIN